MPSLTYSVSIDVPDLEAGIRFYGDAFGFKEIARPTDGYVVLRAGDVEIGLLEKSAGTSPAPDTPDMRRYDRHWTPVHVDFHVADFESVLAGALQAGAVSERQFDGGEHPPVAFCSDPFGNGFCLIGRRPDAG